MDIENKKELVYHLKRAAEIMYDSLPACYRDKVSLEEIQREVTSDETLYANQRDLCQYCEEVISERE